MRKKILDECGNGLFDTKGNAVLLLVFAAPLNTEQFLSNRFAILKWKTQNTVFNKARKIYIYILKRMAFIFSYWNH